MTTADRSFDCKKKAVVKEMWSALGQLYKLMAVSWTAHCNVCKLRDIDGYIHPISDLSALLVIFKFKYSNSNIARHAHHMI